MMKRVVVYSDRQDELVRKVSKAVDFGVSLAISVAVNEMYTAHMMLRERKDLFRHEVKKLANFALDTAKMQRNTINMLIKDKRFFDGFTDRVIDLCENDVTMLRISIKQTLDDAKYKDSEIISYIETARAILSVTSKYFNGLIAFAYDEDYREKENPIILNWKGIFHEYNPNPTYNTWEKMCELLYGNKWSIDLNTERSRKILEKIESSLVECEHLDDCIEYAKEVESGNEEEKVE